MWGRPPRIIHLNTDHFLIAVSLHWLRLILSVRVQGQVSFPLLCYFLFMLSSWTTLLPALTLPLLAVLEKHTKLRKYSVHLGQNAFSPKWVKGAMKPEVWPRGYETGTQGVLFSICDKLPCLGPVSGLRSLVPNPAKSRRILYSGLWGLWCLLSTIRLSSIRLPGSQAGHSRLCYFFSIVLRCPGSHQRRQLRPTFSWKPPNLWHLVFSLLEQNGK